VHDFTKLDIWRDAIRLARGVSRAIPLSSGRVAPGLRAQALKAAHRIADAIAEGCGKNSDFELARFAEIAGGSVSELLSQLASARVHQIISRDVFKRLWGFAHILKRRINAFHRVVRRRAERNDAARKRKKRSVRKDPKRLIPKKKGQRAVDSSSD
jgi:four helix bundle protein